jgi:hypothetical protein
MTTGLQGVRARLNGRTWSPVGFIYTVDGTAYPGAPFPPVPMVNDGSGFWSGFAAGIVGGLMNSQDGLWLSRCIGYPAITYPMGPSVTIGRANLNFAINADATWYFDTYGTYDGLVIVLAGYSQGAMVVNATYVDDIVNPDGVFHVLQPNIYRIYNFGDPHRTPGYAFGNTEIAHTPLPPKVDSQVTGGIAGGGDLTPDITNLLAPDGRHVLNSFVNPGDLYADAPCGADPWTSEAHTGQVETQIFQIVQTATFINVVSLAKDLGRPIATIEAIINAGKFFAAGMASPHFLYFDAMVAAINDALALGNSIPGYRPGY